MSAITRVGDRRFMAKKLFSARTQARKGNWGFAEVYIHTVRDVLPYVSDVEMQQFERCVRLMCRHETRKYYTRVGKEV